MKACVHRDGKLLICLFVLISSLVQGQGAIAEDKTQTIVEKINRIGAAIEPPAASPEGKQSKSRAENDPVIMKVKRLAEEKKFDEAIRELQGALEADPNYTEALYYLGIAYQSVGDHEKSMDTFHKVLLQDRKHYGAMDNLAGTFIAKGDIELARTWFEKSKEIEPNSPISHYNLALIYHDAGEEEKAQQEYAYLKQISPKQAAMLEPQMRDKTVGPRQAVIVTTDNVQVPTTNKARNAERLELRFDDRDWEIGYQASEGNQRMIEYVLKGETVENWTELVTAQSAFGLQKKVSLKDFVEKQKGVFQAMNLPKGAFEWSTISEKPDAILYEWKIQSVDAEEYEIARAMLGKEGIHVAHYATKHSNAFRQRRQEWINLLQSATLAE